MKHDNYVSDLTVLLINIKNYLLPPKPVLCLLFDRLNELCLDKIKYFPSKVVFAIAGDNEIVVTLFTILKFQK